MTAVFKYSLETEQTERLIFRRVLESDYNTWLEFCQFPSSFDYLLTQDQLTNLGPDARCKRWFERVFDRYDNSLGGMNALIDKTSHAFIGQCGLLVQTVDGKEELEIGYSIMPQHRAKGYATEAARKCKEFAFENNFSDSLVSLIHVKNTASIKVALANGMQLDKKTEFQGNSIYVFRIHKGNNV